MSKAQELGTKQFTALEYHVKRTNITQNFERIKCVIQIDILNKEDSKLEIAIRNCKTALNTAMPGWDKSTDLAERTDLTGLAAFARLTK